MVFPYIAISNENDMLENSLISGIIENCEHDLGVKNFSVHIGFSVPMILANMFFYDIPLVPLVSVMFAGHIDDIELVGSTLRNSWLTVTGITLMSSALISAIFSIIVSILWYYTKLVLILLHQEPQVAKLAAFYVKYLIPRLFTYGFI
ncbi:hypothetical protein IEQ34_018031 [Dendrobium chrysotoxum]|uniref:Uncharacterized protein n=1 Tax=Dendrobium chrysotoxum TaxID=161865 RepID=A0AAV7GDQ8_DENCH|nr:hypothetical protein IEQ34_018031 [Dendrobium chrysotoxum]